MGKKKICFVVAIPGTADSFLRDHIAALQEFYDVYLAGNIESELQIKRLFISGWKHIDIKRKISLKDDLKAVFQLMSYFNEMNFDAVHSVTPKAGLLCALAAKMSGIKHRTHIFTGQVWATRHGFMKWMLMAFDKLIAFLDNHILVDGEPQRQFLIESNIVSAKKSLVLGAGSISGVNTTRFTPLADIRKEVRNKLNFQDHQVVFCFMGRQNREKGIYELYSAFNRLAKENQNVVLLMFGSDEEDCMSHLSEYPNIHLDDNFIFFGKTSVPEKDLQAADIFCMPSYREGFGTSVLEASCLGLPVICSDVYGLQDAMVDNETGIRCNVRDDESLYMAMKCYVDTPLLRVKHGENGRLRVLNDFSGEVITHYWVKWYKQLLKV